MAIAQAEVGSRSRARLDQRGYGPREARKPDLDDMDVDGILGDGYHQPGHLGNCVFHH